MPTATESADGLRLPRRRRPYYGGALHASIGGSVLAVTSPSTGAALGTAVDATAEDVDRAVVAARHAFLPWRDSPAQTRAKAIREAAAILREPLGVVARIGAFNHSLLSAARSVPVVARAANAVSERVMNVRFTH